MNYQSFLFDVEVTAKVIAVLVCTFVLVDAMRKFLDRYSGRAQSVININPVHHKFLKHFLTGLIYFVGITWAMTLVPPLKSVALSVFASSGVIALVIGFASQQAFSNIISGLFIELFRPFVIGDQIKTKHLNGIVEDITLRHTIIRTPENNYVMVPNATISADTVENVTWFDARVCKSLEVYIAYQTDLDKALQVVRECIEIQEGCIDARTHEDRERGLPIVTVKVVKLGLDAVYLGAWFWAADDNIAGAITQNAYARIKRTFDEQQLAFACSCSCKAS